MKLRLEELNHGAAIRRLLLESAVEPKERKALAGPAMAFPFRSVSGGGRAAAGRLCPGPRREEVSGSY